MNGLSLNFQGETRVFGPDGNVLVNDSPSGTWSTQQAGGPKDNQIRYDINGAAQPPVPVKYSFNPQNQLQAVIPAAANGGADSDPFTFLGSIQVDDAQDIVYQLIAADTGAATQRNLTLYGGLRFDSKTHNLVIDLTGGGTAEVTGDSGVASLDALKNDITPFKSNDLLRFKASTTNTLTDGTTKKIAADLKFVGNWDLKGNQLVFVSQVKGDVTKPAVTLGFAGKFKAVSAGLAYYADEQGTQFAFNINGQHQWNSGKANWDVFLGYSKKQFTAKVSGNLSINKQLGDQRNLTLSADWLIEHTDGSQTNMKMELSAAYRWSQNNMLTIQAQFSKQGTTLTYDLKVEGKFVFKSGVLTFQIKYNNQDPDNKFSFQIAFTANPTNLIKALSIVLDVTENSVNINFQFEMRMTWIDGKLQKGDPKPLAA
ncbi:MAG TPA: ShlB/FhaC/HecB family hemolysin secretion/activation protein [Pyrinomonadaceae bacterium]|nr:ShlB/FhaC/HecB family hemolysin secretion/activation protein [Pyrinomonadaceae bacterium]